MKPTPKINKQKPNSASGSNPKKTSVSNPNHKAVCKPNHASIKNRSPVTLPNKNTQNERIETQSSSDMDGFTKPAFDEMTIEDFELASGALTRTPEAAGERAMRARASDPHNVERKHEC